ncbi:hypothetical protein F5884DRAFT_846564 [Xylogone sp. PMI_703]|nr:hypothetical protein F5884DRAFT_846564 [Xylogone sp. PMI_703]
MEDPRRNSRELISRGVEIVQGDIDDIHSLDSAFEGADAIFAVTDFWHPFFDPELNARVTTKKSIGQLAYEIEYQRGKNIADAAAKQVSKTLKHFIFSTLPSAVKCSNGKYSGVYHFDSKGDVSEYIQEVHRELSAITSELHVGLYATNWKMGPFMAPQKQTDGSFVLFLPGSGDSLHPIIDVEHDRGIFVHALTCISPGKKVLACRAMISNNDYMAMWSRINKVPARFQEISRSRGGGVGRELGEMIAFSAEFGYNGGLPDVVLPEKLGVNIHLPSLEEYVKREDWSSILLS